MRYPIVVGPAKILEQTTESVKMISDEVIQLLEGMHETMIAHDGIGLAAPQVGKRLRVAIVEIDDEVGLIEMINPEIITKSEETEIDVEGCLSFPGVYGLVSRPYEIVVRYFDREGDEYEVEAAGYLARAIQHEVDHLDGVLFTEKMIKELTEEELEQYLEEANND